MVLVIVKEMAVVLRAARVVPAARVAIALPATAEARLLFCLFFMDRRKMV